jgi:hypothetical protein
MSNESENNMVKIELFKNIKLSSNDIQHDDEEEEDGYKSSRSKRIE